MLVRHPITLLMKETHPLTVTAENTCLLLQDVHAPFMDDQDGYLAGLINRKVLMREFDEYFRLLGLIRPNLGPIADRARELGIAVAYSSLGRRRGQVPSLFQRGTGWDWDLDGPMGRFPDAWAPRDGEPVFAKPGWSALGNPAFGEFLADHGVANVIVAGSMLDYGIRHTCFELMDLGVQSLVVGDACFGMTQAGHIYTNDSIAHGLIKIRNTGELMGLLRVLEERGSVLI